MKALTFIKRRPGLQIILGLTVATVLAFFVHVGTTAPIDSYAACVEAGNPVLDTDPPICRDGTRNFTGTPITSPSPAAPVTSVPFEILVDGDTRSQLPAHRQDLINTPAQWQTYWRQVHAGLSTLPPLIPVDFTTSSVVGVTLGPQTTTGFGLKITSVNTTSAGSTVFVTESTPTITCTVAQALTNRYFIVRTTKLTEPISFRITPEKRHCP